MKRRIGKFKISRELILRHWPECLMIFAEVAPIGITWDYFGVGEYTGFSNLFEELDENIAAPLYEFTFTKKGDVTRLDCKRIE